MQNSFLEDGREQQMAIIWKDRENSLDWDTMDIVSERKHCKNHTGWLQNMNCCKLA